MKFTCQSAKLFLVMIVTSVEHFRPEDGKDLIKVDLLNCQGPLQKLDGQLLFKKRNLDKKESK